MADWPLNAVSLMRTLLQKSLIMVFRVFSQGQFHRHKTVHSVLPCSGQHRSICWIRSIQPHKRVTFSPLPSSCRNSSWEKRRMLHMAWTPKACNRFRYEMHPYTQTYGVTRHQCQQTFSVNCFFPNSRMLHIKALAYQLTVYAHSDLYRSGQTGCVTRSGESRTDQSDSEFHVWLTGWTCIRETWRSEPTRY